MAILHLYCFNFFHLVLSYALSSVVQIRGNLWSRMPSQVVYQTNADWYESYEAMTKNTLVKVDMTKKGLLWFQFIGNKTVFIFSPSGKLQVKWNDINEKKTLFRFLSKLFIVKPNEKLSIKPLRQQTWIEYPVPESFKLYWCDQATELVLKKESPEKPQQTRLQDKLAKITEAVDVLRHEFRFFREPTMNEVALKSGCLDSDALRIGLMFTHCKPESSERARWVGEKAINLAGWLAFKDENKLTPQLIALTQQAVNNASMEVMERAQAILKHNPKLVPTVNNTELMWSKETKQTWVAVFGYPPPAAQSWVLWPVSMRQEP